MPVLENYELQVGDTVRFFDDGEDSEGFNAAPVVSISDKSVELLTFDSRWLTLGFGELAEVNDGRMTKLRELDAFDSDEAEITRKEYLEAWIAKYGEKPSEHATVKGRPSSNTDKSRIILEFIRNSDYPVTRKEIQADTNANDAEFTSAIRNLKNGNKIRQIGERRGAAYAAFDKQYGERPKTEKKAPVSADLPNVDEYVDWLKGKGPKARKDLIEQFNITPQEWPNVAKGLAAHSKVKVTGAKRGTRYES